LTFLLTGCSLALLDVPLRASATTNGSSEFVLQSEASEGAIAKRDPKVIAPEYSNMMVNIGDSSRLSAHGFAAMVFARRRGARQESRQECR
jgi:hypothetical protein